MILVRYDEGCHTWVIPDVRRFILEDDRPMMLGFFVDLVSKQFFVLSVYIQRVSRGFACFHKLDLTLLHGDIGEFEVLRFHVKHFR